MTEIVSTNSLTFDRQNNLEFLEKIEKLEPDQAFKLDLPLYATKEIRARRIKSARNAAYRYAEKNGKTFSVQKSGGEWWVVRLL